MYIVIDGGLVMPIQAPDLAEMREIKANLVLKTMAP